MHVLTDNNTNQNWNNNTCPCRQNDVTDDTQQIANWSVCSCGVNHIQFSMLIKKNNCQEQFYHTDNNIPF